MSEHNTGCGIQHELLFHPTELYEFGPYSFLSRYNCRVGMSRCDPPLARFVSFRFAERMSPTFRYFAIQEDLVNLRDGGFFVPFLPRGKKKETIALSVDGKVDDLY